jgi:hypothetical protein
MFSRAAGGALVLSKSRSRSWWMPQVPGLLM